MINLKRGKVSVGSQLRMILSKVCGTAAGWVLLLFTEMGGVGWGRTKGKGYMFHLKSQTFTAVGCEFPFANCKYLSLSKLLSWPSLYSIVSLQRFRLTGCLRLAFELMELRFAWVEVFWRWSTVLLPSSFSFSSYSVNTEIKQLERTAVWNILKTF